MGEGRENGSGADLTPSQCLASSTCDLASSDSVLLPPSSSNQIYCLSCHCSAPVSPGSAANQVDRKQRHFVAGSIMLCLLKRRKDWVHVTSDPRHLWSSILTYRVFPQSLSCIGLTLTLTLLHLIFKPLSQMENRIWQLTVGFPSIFLLNP